MKKLIFFVLLPFLAFPNVAYAGDSDNRDHNEHRDCEYSENCSDEDFSPEFYESPVTLIVCVHPESCDFA